MTNIFIYSENGGQTRSISKYVREKADGVEGVISTALVNDASSNLNEYFDTGVDRVYQVTSDAISGYNLEQYRAAIMKAIAESSSSIILFSSTKRGTELASSVAALMNAGCMSGCHELEISSEGLTVKKYVLGGSVISEQTSEGEIHVATLSPGPTDYQVRASSIREQVDLTVDVPPSRVTIKEQIAKKKTASNIKDAKIIVS